MRSELITEIDRERDLSVGVVIRCHDETKLEYLRRAVRSLHAVYDVKVYPIISLQRFTDQGVSAVEEILASEFYFQSHGTAVVTNLNDGLEHDARSELVNRGIDKVRELGLRHLAFLDYDDVIYSHSYSFLIRELEYSGASIAFATVDLFEVDPRPGYDYATSSSKPFTGQTKLDLMKDNFCPIHSYLIDIHGVDVDELYFRTDMTTTEDYEFLLRVSAKAPCSFRRVENSVGAYFIRNDGSNTTLSSGEENDQKKALWSDNRKVLMRQKSKIKVDFFAVDFM